MEIGRRQESREEKNSVLFKQGEELCLEAFVLLHDLASTFLGIVEDLLRGSQNKGAELVVGARKRHLQDLTKRIDFGL